MGILRSQVETEVVSELGPLLTLASKSTLSNGANPDLNGPLAFALIALGVTPQNPAAVADVDLSGLGNEQYTQICQLTEYYAIKKCLDSLVIPNEQAQDRRQDWNEMVRRFTLQLQALQAQYQAYLNIRVAPTVAAPYPNRFPTPWDWRHYAAGHGRIDH